MRDEQQETSAEPPTPAQVDAVRDGSIDFTGYSLGQLNELRLILSPVSFPLNHAHLLAELERRSVEPSETPHESLHQAVTVRFTAHGGVRGWLEAKSRRLALYGDGFVEIRPQELVLGGWQRNWLGVAQRTETFIPLHTISDVIQGDGGGSENRREGDWVRLRYETALGRYQFVEFQAGSPSQASALLEALPKARSDDFDRWTAIREFDARVREYGGRPWITPVLVVVNVGVFIATALEARQLDLMSAPQMVGWGTNFGPLTLHGQWWRLLSALFLHGNVPHLLFNMWALWNVGRLTERLYGNWAYAFLYIACGVLSGLASIVWDPSRATLGASGAIFGIFAALVVFALHPHSRVSVKVPTTLWISTALFALYNLAMGFFRPGIDNAAHVGGVLSGLVLGACLVQPLTHDARRGFPFKSIALAAALMVIGAGAAIWQATGLGDQLTGPEKYLRAHQWYLSGENDNLRKWRNIAIQAGSGQLSSTALGERFEQEIVPFWKETSARLKQEESSLPADEREYGGLVIEYSRLRLEWARAIVDAANGNQDRASDATQHDKDSALVLARAERIVMLTSLNHRPRALANSPWIIAATNWYIGRHWKCVEDPESTLGKTPVPASARADGPAARDAAACRAQQLFMSGDYVTLDRWMNQSAAALPDLPDGGSTLDGIVRGLSNLFAYHPADVMQTLGRTVDWRRLAPNSVYPELIQSMIFASWAWDARGHGYASSVSPQTWTIFAQRTEMAAAGLHDVVERANTNPIWYELSLEVGLDQTKPVDELRSIYNRGVIEQPDYWPIYTRMLRILMPRWGGSYEVVNRFIRDVTLQGNGTRNFLKYAKLYWSYSSLERDEAPLFAGQLAAWSTLRQGFRELQSEYPKSNFILNAYAKFACMDEDGISYADARAKLEGRPSTAAWSTKVSLKSCDERFPAAAAAARGHKVTLPIPRVN